MDFLTFLMQSPDLSVKEHAAQLASNWSTKLVEKGTCIIQQGELETKEFIILEGCAVSRIYDPEGRAVCVGLYVAPCIITPNIARTRDGVSLVSLDTTTDARMAQMGSAALTDMMIGYEPVRNWANGVLRGELSRKADREWCLAALGGADRLAWFRERYPNHEEIFVHSLVASFLGVTPVTLSRLRNAEKST